MARSARIGGETLNSFDNLGKILFGDAPKLFFRAPLDPQTIRVRHA